MGVLKDLSIAILIVVLFMLGIEWSLRAAGVNYDASFYRLDRELGYVHRPGASGWNVKEHENYVQISPQGLRDVEHALRRPAGVIRIAVVGDSFSEAREVPQDAAFWAVLERELNRRMPPGGPRVEVVNFGVDGYGLAQEYLLIQHKIWEFDPQIVLLSGTLHSFVLHSSRKFHRVAAEGPVPFFEQRDGSLILDDISKREQGSFVSPSRWSDWIADLSNSSRLLSLANVARRRCTAGLADLEQSLRGRAAAAAAPAGAEDNNEREVLRGPVNADLADAWSIGEDLIRASNAEVTRRKAEFWVFLLDMSPQVDPDSAQRERLAGLLGLPDLFVADRRFADFASREKIPHETLAPEMLAFAESHHVLLPGFKGRPRNSGHWNETGHRLAGRLMAEKLSVCSRVLAGSATAPATACNDWFSR